MNRYRPLTLILIVGLLWLSLVPVARSQDGTPEKIESDDARVTPIGEWHTQASNNASGGNYLYNAPSSVGAGLRPAQNAEEGASEPRPYETALSLNFSGPSIEILYVSGPTLGTLAIEIDGTVLRTVITTAEKTAYGQSSRIDYLTDGPHELKVYAQEGGVVGVDAFITSPPNPLSINVEGEQEGGIQSTTCAPLNNPHIVSLNHLGVEPNTEEMLQPEMSGDGRYLAFTTEASLVPGDADAFYDTYVYDRQTCTPQLISVSSTGAKSNSSSFSPHLSSNGRFVAFLSVATNLVAGDTNVANDIFVYDRHTGQTTRVSVGTGAVQGNGNADFPNISADGRFVSFISGATNLVTGDTNGATDLFVHDRQTGITTRASVATGGAQATGGSTDGGSGISADGRFVVFRSTATNLVAGDTNATHDLFVHDRNTGTTTRVSVATGGTQANGASDPPAISADGRFVTFPSVATNLVAGDTNGQQDIFVHDRNTGTTTRVSVATGGTPATDIFAQHADISGDGRYVVFDTNGTNLVAGDTNASTDIFVHDRQTTTTTRISLTSNGAQANGYASAPSISADGRFIAYESNATNVDPRDTNTIQDIYVAPRVQPVADKLALFRPDFKMGGVFDTLTDPAPADNFTAFSAYAPVLNGQWVMGDWNGDGLETPGVYNNGPFFYTNKSGESQPSDWRSLWIGVAGAPVSGRFNGALPNDCIGAVQTASLGGSTVFVLYFTCQLDGTPAPAISNQWLSAVLPDSGGFSGTHQFKSGDFNSDGVDSIAVRRGTFIAFGNVAPATGPAAFDLAQFIGTPQAGADAGSFVVGDWDASGADSFGLFYQSGEFFYRNDLTFNSGVYVNQSVGTPFGNTGVQATTWR